MKKDVADLGSVDVSNARNEERTQFMNTETDTVHTDNDDDDNVVQNGDNNDGDENNKDNDNNDDEGDVSEQSDEFYDSPTAPLIHERA